MNEKTQLRIALNAISEKLFAFAEFPRVERSRFPEGVCEAAAQVKEEDLGSYSVSLTGKELEAMIVDFPDLKTGEEWERIGTILVSRFSPRIINLVFNLFQDRCHSDALRFLIKKFAEEADRKGQYPDPGRFFWDFGRDEDYFSAINTVFHEEINELDRLFQTYHIGEETAFALEIRRYCLEGAEYPLLLKNVRHLIYLIENAPEESLCKAVSNHILSFDVLDPADEVNQAVLKRLGEPARSEKWEGYSGETKRKFSQWCFCHRLKLHTEEYPLKFKVLSQYYEKVRQCGELEDAPALVIEFEKVRVVDISGRPYSYFYHKEDFDREIRQWREFEILPSFLKGDEPGISARDCIIEEKDDVCILFRYEGFHRLYIKELLDIKLGIVPDFRRMELK